MEIEEKTDYWSTQVEAHDKDRDRKYLLTSSLQRCINVINLLKSSYIQIF